MSTYTLDQRISELEDAQYLLATGTPVVQVTQGSRSVTYTRLVEVQRALEALYALKATTSGRSRQFAKFRNVT